MNWAEIIQALKNLKSSRFYFVVVLIFFLLLGNIYKDPVTVAIKEISLSQVEFRECRDLRGLEITLNELNKKYRFIDSYGVYLYQPTDKSYYKKIILTNSDIIKSTVFLQGSYIIDQPSINEKLKNNDYFVIQEGSSDTDTKFMKEMNIDYLFVYKLHRKEVIGEIVLLMNRKPNPIEMEALVKDISPILYRHII